MQEKDMSNFYNELMIKESSGNPNAKNKQGFAGMYQMGELALDDAGYYNSKDGTPGNNG